MTDFNQQHNRAVWFDLPVAELDRACAFYASVLAVGVDTSEFEGFRMGVLEHQDGNGGCLFVKPEEISSDAGPLLYLNVEGRLREAVERVAAGGGRVLQGAHKIGPHGFRAVILDSEGNRVALHSSVDA